jgi:phytoene dehydrogenase-like protein
MTSALSDDGSAITFHGNEILSGQVSIPDKEAFKVLRERLCQYGELLEPLLSKRPPRLAGGGPRDMATLAKLGIDLRRMETADMREFLRIIGINIYDLLNETLESETLKGAIGFDATLGTHLGPRSPQSLLTYLYRFTNVLNEVRGGEALPKGGMGAITGALEKSAIAAGAEIRTNVFVDKVIVEEGCAVGVSLKDGSEERATRIVSNVDPRATFDCLVGARHFDAGFAHRVKNIRTRGNVAKLNIALAGLPEVPALDANARGGRMVIAPSLDRLEASFNPAKYGEISDDPAIEFIIPTLSDETLAPQGHHVISAVVQYAPYHLKQGWDVHKDRYLELLLDRIASFVPNLSDCYVASEFLSPLDIEKDYLITGGHWHHGELAIDQLLMMRPVPGAAQYKTPLPGLYLCGAGAHPGGGVMGHAGRNAARTILKEGKKIDL